MPLFVEKIEPVKEIQSIEVQPSVTKIENSSVSDYELLFVLSLVLVIYLLRAPLLALCLFVFKLGIISIFAYCGYILMIQ
jgi:hypothetical protein